MRRVNSLLKEAIAARVANLKDPRLGFVTITGVDTSPDLRVATVLYAVIGEDSGTGEALRAAASKIRTEIGGEIRLKYTPELRFKADETVDRSMRITAIFQRLEEESSD